MPIIDDLVGGISQIIAERKAGDFYFTTLDFTYAYGQAALDKKTSKQCNFSLLGENRWEHVASRTGFMGLLQV